MDTGLKSRSNQRSKVKFDVNQEQITSIDRLYVSHSTVSCIFLSQAFHFQEPLNSRKSTGTTGQSMLSKTAWWQALPGSLIHWLCSDR